MLFSYNSIHVHSYESQSDCAKNEEVGIQCLAMVPRKDSPLAFRIPAELKQELQQIADREVRSISQVCEILLRIGVDQYEKDGPKFLQRYLSRGKTE